MATAQEFYLDEKSGVGYVGDFYTDMPINPYDLVFIDGPMNHHGMEVTLPDSTRIAVRGKTFDADYLNVLQSGQRTIPLLIDQRMDTRWKIKELAHGGLTERYHYAAMKFEFTASPEHTETLKRLPIEVIDQGESLYLPVGQNPPS